MGVVIGFLDPSQYREGDDFTDESLGNVKIEVAEAQLTEKEKRLQSVYSAAHILVAEPCSLQKRYDG